MEKLFETLPEFAEIRNDEERIEMLEASRINVADNQTYRVPLSPERTAELESIEKDCYSEYLVLAEEIKELNKRKKELNDKHTECHVILKNGTEEEKGTIYYIEDPENSRMVIGVNYKGIVVERTRRAAQMLNFKTGTND